MKKNLTNEQRKQLDALIDKTEKRSGVQVVLAVIERSDSYIELPWKAFAFGASIAGLLVVILNLPFYDWYPHVTALTGTAAALGGGAAFAFLAAMIPGFAKYFLSGDRAEVEVRQYAQSLFLERELFATRSRTGILMMVSLFERKVVVLPDTGLSDTLSEEAMQKVIHTMAPLLKRKKIVGAFETGLAQLSLILGQDKPSGRRDELPDEIIEEKGV